MIFTEEWLRQYVNPALGTDELADALTMAGLEVEEVRTIAPAFSGVVVGEVLSCRDHENSDHLHVCEVNAGTGETLQIVCGAPNVRAGIKVACATIGAVLPGDFRIKKSKLRGVVSMGMLCSTRELGINEDHNGIWILPDDAPVGVDIRQYARLDDAKIELKLTPNRGDALSVVGVARDVHAITGAPLTLPAMDPVAATCSCAPGGCSGARPLRPLYEPNSSRPECCRSDAGLDEGALGALRHAFDLGFGRYFQLCHARAGPSDALL